MSTKALTHVAIRPSPVSGKLSYFVARLIRAREDAAKESVRRWLSEQSDDRLKSSLGFSEDEIRALRTGEFRVPSAHHSID
jgi:hypothetical protein